MEEANITIHCMCRDEYPSVVFALLSTLPYARKAIVVDTGSTDETRKWLQRIKDKYPDKVSLQFRDDVPDSSQWSFHHYIPPNRYLSQIRGEMIEKTETPFFWIVDGDEVYRDITCRQIVDYTKNWPDDKRVLYVPLLWFAKNIYTLGCFSPPSYGYTGRIFKTRGIKMHGNFPGEMHMGPDGEDLGPSSVLAVLGHQLEPFHHLEMVTKPWRRKITGTVTYSGPQPEVFYRYGIWPKTEKKDEAQNFGGDTHSRLGENRVNATVV